MYIVIAQSNDNVRFIQEVYGPFETHTEAAVYADKMDRSPGNVSSSEYVTRKYIHSVFLVEKP